MTTRPHDVADLYLAPLALELDRRLAEFEGLTKDEIDARVALETDQEPRGAADRTRLMLLCLTHALDSHGWTVDWVIRGLRVSHHHHQLVLGVPGSVRSYLSH